MRGAYFNHFAPTSAVDEARALHKEQCELRLARIANGAEPDHVNGSPAVKNPRASVGKSARDKAPSASVEQSA